MDKTGFFKTFNSSKKEVVIEEGYFNGSPEFVILGVKGHLDNYNSNDFSSKVTEFIRLQERKVVVLDISEVNYMSSTGIGAMIQLNKFCIGNKIILYILGIQKNVEEVFSLLGFKTFFNYIKELKDIKEEKIQRSMFPKKIKCPYCSASILLQKTGSFRCKSCSNIFRVVEKDGSIEIEKRS